MPWMYSRHVAPPVALPPVSGLSLAAWLDASDTTSYVLNGTKVTRWKDKISNKWFVQNDPQNQPSLINSVFPVPVIDFTFSSNNKWMKLEFNDVINTPSPTEAYIVHYWTNPPTPYASWALFNGTDQGSIEHSQGVPYYMIFKSPPAPYSYQYYQAGVLYYYSTDHPNVPGKNIATMYSDPLLANSRIYRNGVESPTGYGAGSIAPTDTFTTVGAADALYSSHGAIAEVLIYNRVLTVEERASTVAYLTTKWGAMTP